MVTFKIFKGDCNIIIGDEGIEVEGVEIKDDPQLIKIFLQKEENAQKFSISMYTSSNLQEIAKDIVERLLEGSEGVIVMCESIKDFSQQSLLLSYVIEELIKVGEIEKAKKVFNIAIEAVKKIKDKKERLKMLENLKNIQEMIIENTETTPRWTPILDNLIKEIEIIKDKYEKRKEKYIAKMHEIEKKLSER